MQFLNLAKISLALNIFIIFANIILYYLTNSI